MAIHGRLGLNPKAKDARKKLNTKAGVQSRSNKVQDVRNKLNKKKGPAVVQKKGIKTLANKKILQNMQSGGIKNLNDIRFKLIEKERLKITDARDKLAEISKKSDARLKLQSLRKMNAPNSTPNNKAANKQIHGPNKLNEISGSKGSKTVIKKGALTRTVPGSAGAVKRSSAFLTKTIEISQRKFPHKRNGQGSAKSAGGQVSLKSDRRHPLKNNPTVVTIKNEKATPPRRSSQSNSLRRNISPWDDAPLSARPSLNQPAPFNSFASVYAPQALEQSMQYMAPRYPQRSGFGMDLPPQAYPVSRSSGFLPESPRNLGYDDFSHARLPTSEMYKDRYNMSFQESRPTSLRITAFSNRMEPPQSHYEDNYDALPRLMSEPIRRSRHDPYEEQKPLPPKQTNQNKDNFRSGNEGFKVMITNLHKIVTVDDIRELFGCVGPIHYARMIREGIAEVAFIREEDAQRSVDVYHNRQLDQQPMSVTMITKSSAFKKSGFNAEFQQKNLNENRNGNLYSNNAGPRNFKPAPRPAPSSNPAPGSFPRSSNAQQFSRPNPSNFQNNYSRNNSFNFKSGSSASNASKKSRVVPDLDAIHYSLFSI